MTWARSVNAAAIAGSSKVATCGPISASATPGIASTR